MTSEAYLDNLRKISVAMEETVKIIESLDLMSEGYRQLFQDYLSALNKMVKAGQIDGHESEVHSEGEEIRQIILRAVELSARDNLPKEQSGTFAGGFDKEAFRNLQRSLRNIKGNRFFPGFVVPKRKNFSKVARDSIRD